MSQTSMSTPKVMPSYSNLWEACITNLCHPHLIQMQRYPAPPTPAPLSTSMTSCSPLHPEMFPWAHCLQTTSPSKKSSQLTTCPMEKPSNGSMTQQALLQPREKALTATATMLPIPAHHHHQTLSSPLPNNATSAVRDIRWHSQPGTPHPLQIEEPVFIVHDLHWTCSLLASPWRDPPPLKTFPPTMPPHQKDTTFHPLVRTPHHQLKLQNLQYWEASKNT